MTLTTLNPWLDQDDDPKRFQDEDARFYEEARKTMNPLDQELAASMAQITRQYLGIWE